MRFHAFTKGGRAGLGLRTDTGLRGYLQDQPGYPGTLDDILREDRLAEAGAALARAPLIEGAAAALPFTRAGKILCVGLNYADHAAETNIAAPPFPTVFVRFNDNLCADGEPLVVPALSGDFDYEGELVAVIGKPGRAIPADRALEHVAGYTLFNDGSIRDYQMMTPQWTVGKNFDSTGSMGPDFVTADELPAGARGLRITTTLNGQVVQDANTDLLLFDVATLVARLSSAMTLRTGDLIVTGTPSGVGMARTPPLWMKAGDTCEITVEGVGTLRNGVVAEG